MAKLVVNERGAFLEKEVGPVFLSGGFGSEVSRILSQQNGVRTSAFGNFRSPLHVPPVVQQVHEAYAKAGADVLTADSFDAGMGKRRAKGDRALAEQHAEAAGKIARIASSLSTHKPLVALSLTSSGDCYNPKDTPTEFDLHRDHKQNVEIFKPHGDFIIAETLPTLKEGKVIAQYAQETQTPVLFAFVVNDEGKVNDGSTMEQVVNTVLRPHPYVLGVGVNCCSIEGANEAVSQLSEIFQREAGVFEGKQIAAYANAFALPREVNASLTDDHGCADGHHHCGNDDHNKPLTREESLAAVRELVQRGATTIGLCCGSTPDHTRDYVHALGAGRAAEAAPAVKLSLG